MESHDIPEGQWVEFFDRFSREHVGWAATIEVLDAELGPQRLAEGLALHGISFDTKGTRPCSIEVGVGDGAGRHLNHVVDMPLHIRQAEAGAGEVDIQIEPARGPVTLVHLREPRVA